MNKDHGRRSSPSRCKRSLLELNNQLERAARASWRASAAADEQLARDVAELQRRQKDIAQGVDERMRKLEPQTRARSTARSSSPTPEEKRQYDEAIAIAARRRLRRGAASALQSFLRATRPAATSTRARFWLGNALYGKRDYKEAVITMFRSFIANARPDHPRVPEALLAHGQLADSK